MVLEADGKYSLSKAKVLWEGKLDTDHVWPALRLLVVVVGGAEGRVEGERGLAVQHQAAAAHVSPLAARAEVVQVLLVSAGVVQLRRELRAGVRGEVCEAAHALGSGGAWQRPRGRVIPRAPGLVTLHPLAHHLQTAQPRGLPPRYPETIEVSVRHVPITFLMWFINFIVLHDLMIRFLRPYTESIEGGAGSC